MNQFSQARFEAARQQVQASAPVNGSAALFTAELHDFASLPSTNQTAWEFLDRGAPAGTAVLAMEQTAGRGQWGRPWRSAPGGLYLSVVLTPNLAAVNSAQLTLCTVWGIAGLLRDLPNRLSTASPKIPLQIKWLNDLVIQGRKLGGILTETRMQQGQITKAVVGVGINWTNPVPDVGVNLESVLQSQLVESIDSLEMLAAIVLHGLLTGYQCWQQSGIEPLLPEYFSLLAYRDRPISIEDQMGTIVGVTATGELKVQLQRPLTSVSSTSQPPTGSEILLKPGTISLGYHP